MSSIGGWCVCVGLVSTPRPLYAFCVALTAAWRGSGKALRDDALPLAGSSFWLESTSFEIAIELGAVPPPKGCLVASWPLSRHQSPPVELAAIDVVVLAGLVAGTVEAGP